MFVGDPAPDLRASTTEEKKGKFGSIHAAQGAFVEAGVSAACDNSTRASSAHITRRPNSQQDVFRFRDKSKLINSVKKSQRFPGVVPDGDAVGKAIEERLGCS